MPSTRPAFVFPALLLASCGTASLAVGVPESHEGPVAVVDGYTHGTLFGWFSSQVPATVVAVDGKGPAGEYRLLPGSHRFTMKLRGRWNRFSGDVALPVPAARSYEIVARWNGDIDRFEVALVDLERAAQVAEASVERSSSGPNFEALLNPLNWITIPIH